MTHVESGNCMGNLVARGDDERGSRAVASRRPMATITVLAQVIRGGVSVRTAPGAGVVIVNRSRNLVVVGGGRYDPGEACLAMVADAGGVAKSGPRDLPYGTYEALVGGASVTFRVREEGKFVDAIVPDGS